MTNKYSESYMLEAIHESHRSHCAKIQVGCIGVSENGMVVGRGANRSPSDIVPCTVKLCKAYFDANESCPVVHSEIDMLIGMGRTPRLYAVYITRYPCVKCALALSVAGCEILYYLTPNQKPWDIPSGFSMEMMLAELSKEKSDDQNTDV